MVVLLRAFTHLDAYEDSLERAGLRPYVVGGRGYWSQQQVADVCALLATIANPLDDQALFGALASPACGARPGHALAAARGGRAAAPRLAGAGARASGAGEAELAEPERLDADPRRPSCELLRELRGAGSRRCASAARGSPLAGADRGGDDRDRLRPGGADAARRRGALRQRPQADRGSAAEFEAREGRDLRGLLDFLAARAESDAEAQAATAAEGHDGVRIMTVHNAKGLEFEVVAVPDLSRSLLAGGRPPVLVLGREQPPRVGMQLRRLGSGVGQPLRLRRADRGGEGARRRGGPAPLPRRRHPRPRAADPQRRRQARAGHARRSPGTPVVERLVEALGVERDADAAVPVPPPEPRPGLDAAFAPARDRGPRQPPLARARGRAAATSAATPPPSGRSATGPPPLVERRPPIVPSRPLSYTAISAYEECAYRFYMERVLGLAGVRSHVSPHSG